MGLLTDVNVRVKKDLQTTYSPQITYPYANYSPTIAQTYQPSVNTQKDIYYNPIVQIESPQAVATPTYTTKKETTTETSTDVSPAIDQGQTQQVSPVQQNPYTEATGNDMLLLVGGLILIGGVGYYVYKNSKKSRKKIEKKIT